MKDGGFGHPKKGGTNAGRGSSAVAPEPPEPPAQGDRYLAPPSGQSLLAGRHQQAPSQVRPLLFFWFWDWIPLKGLYLIRSTKNVVFKGSRRNLVSEGLNNRKQWHKIYDKLFWYFKTCLVSEPWASWIRNDRTHEDQPLGPSNLHSSPGPTTY